MFSKKLAIFDLDGTLFDTSDVNYMAYRAACNEHGAELDRDFFVKECNGRHYREFIPRITGDPSLLEPIHEAKKRLYNTFLDHARMNTVLFDIIESIAGTYRIALVTTASRRNVEDILEHFRVKESFELIITQEDIKKPKPDPEGFLMAMEHFGVLPENTVIFEDSDVGIEAARRSGATVFAVERF